MLCKYSYFYEPQKCPILLSTLTAPFLLRIPTPFYYKGLKSLYLYPLRTPMKWGSIPSDGFCKTEAPLRQKIWLKITKKEPTPAMALFHCKINSFLLQRGRITLSISIEDSCEVGFNSMGNFLQNWSSLTTENMEQMSPYSLKTPTTPFSLPILHIFNYKPANGSISIY